MNSEQNETDKPESEQPDGEQPADAAQPNAAQEAQKNEHRARQPRLRELLAIPERDRSDAVWDEIIELEITLAPGNRVSGPQQGEAGRRHDQQGGRGKLTGHLCDQAMQRRDADGDLRRGDCGGRTE